MAGPLDFESSVEYWQQDRWSGCFPVKWHIIKDIPNIVLRKITLENNENRPVTNSRDTREGREKVMQERKSKEHQSSRHVSELGDTGTNETVKMPESVGETVANESASADLASVSLEPKALPLEECGSAEALEDSSELPNK